GEDVVNAHLGESYRSLREEHGKEGLDLRRRCSRLQLEVARRRTELAPALQEVAAALVVQPVEGAAGIERAEVKAVGARTVGNVKQRIGLARPRRGKVEQGNEVNAPDLAPCFGQQPLDLLPAELFDHL